MPWPASQTGCGLSVCQATQATARQRHGLDRPQPARHRARLRPLPDRAPFRGHLGAAWSGPSLTRGGCGGRLEGHGQRNASIENSHWGSAQPGTTQEGPAAALAHLTTHPQCLESVRAGTPNHPPIHTGFRVGSRLLDDAFCRAAMVAGARDNGGPGLRPHGHPHYYGASVLDPDGHPIEAVCHEPV